MCNTHDHSHIILIRGGGDLASGVALFNQADSVEPVEQVKNVTPRLLKSGYERVIAASLLKAPLDLSIFQ